MELYLVRHGQALNETEDHQRPLSPKGREDVKEVVEAALKKGMFPARILHSGKLRAKETAEILAATLVPRQGISQINGLAPQDDPMPTKVEIESEEESLALVGHLPHLEGLLSLLVSNHRGAARPRFSTATIVCLAKEGSGWKVQWTLSPADA